MELKGGGLLCKPLASLYGVWIPKWKHTAGNPSAGFSQRRRAAAGEGEAHLAPLSHSTQPLQHSPLPPSLGERRGNYIIWSRNESTLLAGLK